MAEMWADIPGWASPYRINSEGVVQQLRWGRWITLSQKITPKRAEVRLRDKSGVQRKAGVFRLLDEAFCGGYAKKHGLCVGPKNGVRQECTLKNMAYRTHEEIGRRTMSRVFRKPVARYAPDGRMTLYHSVNEAARKNGLSRSALDRRLYGGVLDPRGFRFEIVD